MNKFLVGFLSIFFVIQAHAYKLNYYQCPNKESALSCSSNCLLSGSIEFGIETNNDLEEIYFITSDNNNVTTDSIKNCIIKNIKNWSCSSDEIFSILRHTMMDGKYFSSSSYRMLDGEDDKRFFCGTS